MAEAQAKGELVLLSLNGLSGDPNWIFTLEDGDEMDGVCLMGPGHRVPWFTVHRNWTVDVNDPNCLTDASIRLLLETERVQKILMDMPLEAFSIEIADIRDTEVSTWVYDPNKLTDDVIRKLCSSGRICEVMGHQWKAYRDDPGDLVYHRYPVGYERRKCVLCRRMESRQLTEWE